MNYKCVMRWLGMVAAVALLPGCSGEQADAAAASSPPAGSAAAAVPGAPVNVNTATLEQLDTLPGIGKVTAEKIIEGRPYQSPEDLLKVKGIGERTLEDLRPLIEVK